MVYRGPALPCLPGWWVLTTCLPTYLGATTSVWAIRQSRQFDALLGLPVYLPTWAVPPRQLLIVCICRW